MFEWKIEEHNMRTNEVSCFTIYAPKVFDAFRYLYNYTQVVKQEQIVKFAPDRLKHVWLTYKNDQHGRIQGW